MGYLILITTLYGVFKYLYEPSMGFLIINLNPLWGFVILHNYQYEPSMGCSKYYHDTYGGFVFGYIICILLLWCFSKLPQKRGGRSVNRINLSPSEINPEEFCQVNLIEVARIEVAGFLEIENSKWQEFQRSRNRSGKNSRDRKIEVARILESRKSRKMKNKITRRS